MFTPEGLIFRQEISLAQHALLSGLDYLRNFDYTKQGSLYPAFFQLSIGIERFLKLVLIVDHKVKNGLSNPSFSTVKNYGHDLVELYQAVRSIDLTAGPSSRNWNVEGAAAWELLELLSQFARRTRYFNLDEITSAAGGRIDPLKRWYQLHHQYAFFKLESNAREQRHRAVLKLCDKRGLYGFTLDFQGNYKDWVTVLVEQGNFQAANPYWCSIVLELLRPAYEVFEDLALAVRSLDIAACSTASSFPEIEEYFGFILMAPADALRQKEWLSYAV